MQVEFPSKLALSTTMRVEEMRSEEEVSTVITIRGDSYRLREKRRSGLLQKTGPTPETNETAKQ